MKKLITYAIISILLSVNISSIAQNMEMLLIEQVNDNSVIIPEQCSPEDLIVVISSSIPDLKFESNMLSDEDFKVTYLADLNQYVICHEKTKFILSISGSNFQSEDIKIHDLDVSHVYRITVNIAKGTVNIVTNPNNATVLFLSLDNAVFSSSKPITNITGKYEIRIVKADYQTLDTVITIPRDEVYTYNFDLKPLFSPVKLDLKSYNNAKFETPPIIWIDSIRISLDALVNPTANVKSFFNGVEFYSLYEENIIPIFEGNHKIRVECENYKPFESFIYTKIGQTYDLDIILESVFGYLTIIDELNSEGAKVFLNDQFIDYLPIFKLKATVGDNRIRVEKPGYIAAEDEFIVNVLEGENTDLYIDMEVSRKVTFVSKPHKAQVFINDERLGFTPVSKLLAAGYHDILIKKSGYSSQKFIKHIDERSEIIDDTISISLLLNYPLSIISEEKDLEITLDPINHSNLEITIDSKTPSEILVPYGQYQLTLSDKGGTTFKGIINHNDKRKQNIIIPSYSRTSFTAITADFINTNNYEISLGRSAMFPNSGLSTSIVNIKYYNFEVDNIEYKTIIPYVFLLNWDWRLGGSILRQLDVCVLGRVGWTPGMQIVDFHLDDNYYDATMWNYFYGIEISSRISYINLNCKIGKQIYNGTVNIWDKNESKYTGNGHNVNVDNFVVSLGVTIGGNVFKSNNMLRLWRKPFVGNY